MRAAVTIRPAVASGSGGRRRGTGRPTVPAGSKRAGLHLQAPVLSCTRTTCDSAFRRCRRGGLRIRWAPAFAVHCRRPVGELDCCRG